MSNSLQPHGLQHARLPCLWLSSRVCSDSCLLSQWCYLTITSSVTFFFLPSIFSQNQGVFQWVESLHQVVKVMELQHQSFQWVFRVDFHLNWLVWSPCKCDRLSGVVSSFTPTSPLKQNTIAAPYCNSDKAGEREWWPPPAHSVSTQS